MRDIGRIKQVQIQRSSLKLGERPYRVYDPAPLMVVDSLLFNARGVIGLNADGARIIDVHHRDHPTSRNNGGVNGLSIGFTSHYRAMTDRYGDHVINGCAGENILVETEDQVELADLGARLVIRDSVTGESVYLTEIMVAAPCIEFCHYVHKANLQTAPLVADAVKAGLQFLGNGMRGFYLTPAGMGRVRAGDILLSG